MRIRNFLLGALSIFAIFSLFAYFNRESYVNKQTKLSEATEWDKDYKNIKLKDHYKIAIITNYEARFGCRAFAERVEKAASNIGWTAKAFNDLSEDLAQIKEFNPDFILSTNFNINFPPKFHEFKIYAGLYQPFYEYFEEGINIYPKPKANIIKNINKVDGYLISFGPLSIIKELVEGNGRKFYGIKSYKSAQTIECTAPEPKSLLYYARHMDRANVSQKYKMLFQKLTEIGLLNVYGPRDMWTYISNARVKLDYNSTNAHIEDIKGYGISLVVENKKKVRESVPSGRFFESVAACNLVISSQNDFIVKNFGKTVLYFNPDQSAKEIYNTIVNHLKWIKANPEAAKNLVLESHKLFKDNFALEHELKKVAQMHEFILKDIKN